MFDLSRQGAVDILQGSAPIDAHAVEALDALAADPLARAMPKLVFDLSAVPLLDSKGLEWLIETHRRCLEQGGHLRVAAPTPLCRDILDVTGLAEELDVFADTVAAVGSFVH